MLRTVDLKRQTETCFFILLMRTSDDGTEVGLRLACQRAALASPGASFHILFIVSS